MRVYTAHIQPISAAEDGEAILVKEGFSWPAFLFTVLWAVWHLMWVPAALILAVALAIGGVVAVLGLDVASQSALQLGYQVLIGFLANDWRRHQLRRRGYVEVGVVAARDRASAERRFFAARTESGASA
ncbi:MAG: DUF2628 domain-containing protein [Alphaproteobacteria bacterium]